MQGRDGLPIRHILVVSLLLIFRRQASTVYVMAVNVVLELNKHRFLFFENFSFQKYSPSSQDMISISADCLSRVKYHIGSWCLYSNRLLLSRFPSTLHWSPADLSGSILQFSRYFVLNLLLFLYFLG